MNKEKKAFQFDDLINDFFTSLETDDETQVLENYINDFPEYESEFLEAAVYRRTVAELPEREYSKEEEEKLNLRTQSIVQNVLYKYRQSNTAYHLESEKNDEAAVLAIDDLIGEIEKKGFTLKTFGEITRLPETVFEAFNTREVRFGSIVRQAIKNVASVLGIPEQTVDNFLLLASNPQPMHARADESPRFSSQMEFLELIETDPDLRDDDKQYWLSQKTQEDE